MKISFPSSTGVFRCPCFLSNELVLQRVVFGCKFLGLNLLSTQMSLDKIHLAAELQKCSIGEEKIAWGGYEVI